MLTEHGHTLDVVYINYSENNQKLTVALKVSPSIRNALFQTQQGHIGNSSLPIEDRFFFKQCFHCQEIGHFSSDCPKSADSPALYAFTAWVLTSRKIVQRKGQNQITVVVNAITQKFPVRRAIANLIMQQTHSVLLF